MKKEKEIKEKKLGKVAKPKAVKKTEPEKKAFEVPIMPENC